MMQSYWKVNFVVYRITFKECPKVYYHTLHLWARTHTLSSVELRSLKLICLFTLLELKWLY